MEGVHHILYENLINLHSQIILYMIYCHITNKYEKHMNSHIY